MSDIDLGLDDDIFADYDLDDADLNRSNQQTVPQHSSTQQTKKDDLGLDEDIVVKPRKPRFKLTNEILLGPKGLPRIRKEAPEKIGKKLRGKGYEYKDAARILAFYKYWADDLYRKAPFPVALKTIESLGHKRDIRKVRHEWLLDAKYGEDRSEFQVKDYETSIPGGGSDGNGGNGGQGEQGGGGDGVIRREDVPEDPDALFKGMGGEEEEMEMGEDSDDDEEAWAALMNMGKEKESQPVSGPELTTTTTTTGEKDKEVEKGKVKSAPQPRQQMVEDDGPPPPEPEDEDFGMDGEEEDWEALEAMRAMEG